VSGRNGSGSRFAPYSPPAGSIPTLEVPSLEGIERIHLIGIGGAGMRGIARILLARGVAVTGSDLKSFPGEEELRRSGATIFSGHDAGQLGDADVVVVSSAVPPSNPELAAARTRSVPVLARAQVLAALSSGMRTFGIAGTHGKTTTTSMLAVVLERAALDPTFVIGGDLNESGSGARAGGGAFFVAETDESDGSFLLLHPEVGIVTNVEEDHLDFYRDGEEIRSAFAQFAGQCERLIVCGDDPGVREVLASTGREDAITYGVDEGNAATLGPDGDGAVLHLPDGEAVRLDLQVPGLHNLRNAAAVVLAATLAGVDAAAASASLRAFSGVRRRFELRGEAGGATFVDDYAHHPTEIAATLRAASGRSAERVLAVFQPHRYTRTRALWRALGESLGEADLVVVTDVYDAGEQPIPGISGKLLIDALAEARPSMRMAYLPRRGDVLRFLEREVRPGDLVLTLGAGDITMVSEEILERVREDGG
jgi:UDP-N-acetylmuramate--alanine ligase